MNQHLQNIIREHGLDPEDKRLLSLIKKIGKSDKSEEASSLDNYILSQVIDRATCSVDIIRLINEEGDFNNSVLVFRNESAKKILPDDSKLYIHFDELSELIPSALTNKDACTKRLVFDYEQMVSIEQQEIKFELVEFKQGAKSKKYRCYLRIEEINNHKYLVRRFYEIYDFNLFTQLEDHEQDQLSKGIIDALPGGVTIISSKGELQYASKQVGEIFSWPAEFVAVGTRVSDYFIEEDQKRLIQYFTEKENYSIETLNLKGKRYDGTIFPCQAQVKKFCDQSTGEDSIISFVRDNSQNQEALNLVNERKAIYEALINNSFSAIDISEIRFDDDNQKLPQAYLLLANQRMKDIFEIAEGPISQDEMQEQLELTFNGTQESIQAGLNEIFQNTFYIQKVTIKKGGKEHLFNALVRLIIVGKKTFIIRIFDDITEASAKQDIIDGQISALKARKQELEKYIESNLQLEKFAYIAAHDLKAPLSTVLSFSQLIKRSSYDRLLERDQNFLDIVIQSTNNMMLLIEDLLTFSRVNTKKFQIESIVIEDLIETVMIDLTTSIQQKQAEIKWDLGIKAIRADKIKLLQLFENLLRNSIKFTKPDDKPQIQVSLEDQPTHYLFKLRDNGIGISQDHLKKVFGIFEKLHSKNVFEGTGLGLSICAKIVEQHQGQIWVESELDQGSTFYFTISKEL